MIDINPQVSSKCKGEMSGREYEVDEPETAIYVEKATSFIYEVKLFPDFALVRLAMPDYQPPVQRVDLLTLAELFEEFAGDEREIRSLLFGSTASNILVEKKP